MNFQEKKEGILILGTPRSGTTLLRRLLNAHPHITCPGETSIFSASARFLHSEAIAEGVEIGVVPGLGYAGFSETEVMNRIRDFAFSFHKDYMHRKNKNRWAEKTAFDSFYTKEIERICQDHVHYICIIRNGFDFVVSMQELCDKNQMYLSEVHEYIKKYPKPLEAFAHCWVEITSNLLSLSRKNDRSAMLIRYEDLVSAPETEIKKVFHFIGEDFPENLIKNALSNKGDMGLGDWKTYATKAICTSSVGRAACLSTTTRSRLGEIMNNMLEKCGYLQALGSDSVESSEQLRRRYELGLMISGMRENNADA